MELKFYRHKTERNLYLARNTVSNGETNFYYVTTDSLTAIKDANKPGFDDWMYKNDRDLKAKITLKVRISVDGYEGWGYKEVSYHVKDFEKVVLSEKKKLRMRLGD